MAVITKDDVETRSASIEKAGEDSIVEVASVKPVAIAYGGEEALPPPPDLTPAQVKALYRKIDMKLMPILTLMYLCSFLDRGNIGESPYWSVRRILWGTYTHFVGNAKLQGLLTQLDLTGNKYNIALVRTSHFSFHMSVNRSYHTQDNVLRRT